MTAPAPTEEDCLRLGGSITKDQIQSILLPDPLEFRVYLPPCYQVKPDRRYPVLYLIHGLGFTDDQWERLDAGEIADRLIAAGESQPFLMVMPYDPSPNNPDVDLFGEAFVQDLIPWIDGHYRTRPDRAGRAIGGLSRGAGWAIHLGLSHWELFSSLGAHSPSVFLKDTPRIEKWLDAIPPDQLPRIYMDISINDQKIILSSAEWFENLLTKRDIPHEWYFFTGFHDEEYWQAHMEKYLRWYTAAWQTGE